MSEKWSQYVTALTEDGLQKDAADAAGIDQSSISRWKSGKLKAAPDAHKVVAFARALGRPPVEALAAASYITDSEAHDVITVRQSPADITDDDLARELLDRLGRLRGRHDLKTRRHGWSAWDPRNAVSSGSQNSDHRK